MSHFVYVCLDANRKPLYVGCTNDVDRRMKEHRGYGTWASDVAQVLTTEFDTEAEALAAEQERIWSLRPAWNRRHNLARIKCANAVAWYADRQERMAAPYT